MDAERRATFECSLSADLDRRELLLCERRKEFLRRLLCLVILRDIGTATGLDEVCFTPLWAERRGVELPRLLVREKPRRPFDFDFDFDLVCDMFSAEQRDLMGVIMGLLSWKRR